MMFVLGVLMGLALTCGAHAATLHVGATQTYGNIQAASAAVSPGDTIVLHAGTYGTYQFVENVKGAAGKWIVVRPNGSEKVVINGMWQFSKISYWKFEDLAFEGSTAFPGRLFLIDNGGSCATQAKHIIVDRCSFTKTTDTVYAVFKYAGVDSFEVRHCVFKDLAAGAFDYNTCHYGVISDNRIENCLTGGHIKGGASFITMERNLFRNASRSPWVAFELGGDTSPEFYCEGSNTEVHDLKFYANLIIGGYRGLALSSAVNCQVVNNTFYETAQATIRFLTTSKLYPTLSGNYVVNNIFAFGAESQYINGGAQPFGSVIMANNIYYSTTNPSFAGPYWDTPALDKIKELNPIIVSSTTSVFVDGASADLHLAPSSPAIGSGLKTNDPTTDFYGYAYKEPRSIGAAEYGSSLVDVAEQQHMSAEWTVAPNPALRMVRIRSASGVDGAFDVEIISMFGEVVAHSSGVGMCEIDCALQPAGWYAVHVRPIGPSRASTSLVTIPLLILK